MPSLKTLYIYSTSASIISIDYVNLLLFCLVVKGSSVSIRRLSDLVEEGGGGLKGGRELLEGASLSVLGPKVIARQRPFIPLGFF